MRKDIYTTDHADLIAYHAARTDCLPSLYFDTRTMRVYADVSEESRKAFQADLTLRHYLNVKVAIWREIGLLRGGK